MKTLDFRSDTVTRPSAAMRRVMAEAEVGDDVYGEDPCVNALEATVAARLGHEAGVLFPSGTMANQACLNLHTRPGDIILGADACHILRYEAGAAAAISGAQIQTLGRGGIFGVAELEPAIQAEDLHRPATRLLAVENTHNAAGGIVFPQETLKAVCDVARGAGIALHLDGARIWNASVASGVALDAIAAPFDTVSVCLSKGLGAPVGSVVVARTDDAARLRRIRKRLGGAMRQAGVLAAAGLYALEHHVDRLADDHANARRLAEGLAALGFPIEAEPQTNMVMFPVSDPKRFQEQTRALGVWINPIDAQRFRAVTHLDVSAPDIEDALERLAECRPYPYHRAAPAARRRGRPFDRGGEAAMIHDYSAFGPDRVLSGVGAVESLGAELDALGAKRALLVTGRTLATQTDLVARVEAILGDRHAATFSECGQHVPGSSVDAATTLAKRCAADALVVFGGGSPTDTAKMVAMKLFESGGAVLPQITMPTTLSAGEFTYAAGMTDETTRVKHVYLDTRMQPKVVIFDPELTVPTPSWLWASTGVKALDHAVEGLWWPYSHPILETLAVGAIQDLRRHLPASADPTALDDRLACQHAAWKSLFGLMNTKRIGLRLSHPMGHQIGAHWDIPHGVTSCIVLPSACRFLLERTGDAQAVIGRAMGLEGSDAEVAAGCADAIDGFIDTLDVPRRLSTAGAKREEIPDVARSIAAELEQFEAPDRDIATPEALAEMLEALW